MEDDYHKLFRSVFDPITLASSSKNRQKLKQVKKSIPLPEVKPTKKQLHVKDMNSRKATLQKELETTKDQKLRYALLDQFHKNSNDIDNYWNDYTSKFDDLLSNDTSQNTKGKK